MELRLNRRREDFCRDSTFLLHVRVPSPRKQKVKMVLPILIASLAVGWSGFHN